MFDGRSTAAGTAALLGSASLVVLVSAQPVWAQAASNQMAQAAQEMLPEQVLVTGSLIRGTAAVGVPVTSLGNDDFKEVGALNIQDLLNTIPALESYPSDSSAASTVYPFVNGINIHHLNGTGQRSLMLIDGMRSPLQRSDETQYDPSIIPAIALDRLDVLTDGASATYGSDAVAGVVNLILKRGYDGALTQAGIGTYTGGGLNWSVDQLFGRKWNGGDITLSYEHLGESPLLASSRSYYTANWTPWGLENETPVKSADPGIVSTGAPNANNGTGCTNCYSVPKGQNGVGLTWAQLLANTGSGNEINPNYGADITSRQNNNLATVTFDQDIFPGVQFNAEGYYSNRRVQLQSGGFTVTAAVPTINPYYPTGAPSGLRVSYNFAPEYQQTQSAVEISERYMAGFTIDLPDQWEGRIFGSENQEGNNSVAPAMSSNNITAALGGTVAATPATVANPGIPSFTKPSSVPYLNLFCDSLAYDCIDPATLAYIEGFSTTNSTYILQQYGASFDGPLFDLPGGQVRAAIGGSYEKDDYRILSTSNPVTTQITQQSYDSEGRNIWSAYSQLNIPIIGDNFTLPLVQKFEVEGGVRFDRYSDFGDTTNPKVAANWTVGSGLTLRSTWGTSYRAPNFKDLSPVVARGIGEVNVAGEASGMSGGGAAQLPACAQVGGTPVPGSVAAILNPTCSAQGQFPIGIEITGGVGGLAGVTRPADYHLGPEKGKNLAFGFDFAPDFDPLRGLDINATWYNLTITGPIEPLRDNFAPSFGLNDPTTAFTYILRGDPRFQTALAWAFSTPPTNAGNTLAQITQSQVMWINDGASQNAGVERQQGIDFSASYVIDLGDFGAWNAGITGTYKIHDISSYVPGTPGVDVLHTLTATGYETQDNRLRWRSRLGWAEGPYSATMFVDYQSHYYVGGIAFPPPAQLAEFPNFSFLQPASYLFDTSLGYNLGDQPANIYLQGLSFQLAVNNIFNRNPQFVYGSTLNTFGYDGKHYSPAGRTFRFIISKQW
jgi:iron complex outermembrane receptor protein